MLYVIILIILAHFAPVTLSTVLNVLSTQSMCLHSVSMKCVAISIKFKNLFYSWTDHSKEVVKYKLNDMNIANLRIYQFSVIYAYVWMMMLYKNEKNGSLYFSGAINKTQIQQL